MPSTIRHGIAEGLALELAREGRTFVSCAPTSRLYGWRMETEAMIEWWQQFELTQSGVLWGVLFFVSSFVGSLAVAVWVLVKLPATYFAEDHPRAFRWAERYPALRWIALIVKNFLGVALIILGILLSLPGIPGQGILTILIGLMLLNFPGKRRLERKLVSRPRVLQAINRIRARFGKPPLVLGKESTRRSGHDSVRIKRS
jgi:hypothetical protein